MSVAPIDVENPKPRRSSWAMFGGEREPPRQASTFLSIPLSAFPADARPLLAKFDGDGNGNIDIKELEVAAQLYEASQQKVARLGRLLVFGSFLLAAVLASMAGLTYVVVDRLKDTSVSTDGFMMTKNGENTLTVSAVQTTKQNQLSSFDPDETLRALKYIETYSLDTTESGETNGAWTSVSLPVMGYTRRVYSPNNDTNFASIVTFLIPNGAVILNGTDMTVEVDGAIGLQSTYVTSLASVFPVVMHAGSGRRLQMIDPANPNQPPPKIPGGTVGMSTSTPGGNSGANTKPGSQPTQQPSGQGGQQPSGQGGQQPSGQGGQQPSGQGGQQPNGPPSGGQPNGAQPRSPCGGAPTGPATKGTCPPGAVAYNQAYCYARC